MTEHYRTFQIDGGVQPIPETLLGRITSWYATGTILYKRSDHSLVELARFRLACMKFDDKDVAERFGLELARLFVDSFYRDLVIQRYETEKRRVQQNRSRH